MRRIRIIGIFILIVAGCDEPIMEVDQLSIEMSEVEIPEMFILSSDSEISKKQDGSILYNGNLFSGYLIHLYPNDTIAIKNGYYNGKLNGIMTAYYENGGIRSIRPYQNGEKHGTHIGFHRNGEKAFEYHFVAGFSEGNHKEWYSNGLLAADMNYIKGKEFGRQQAWRIDGKVRSNYIVRENGRRYGLMGIKRCTKLDGVNKIVDPYKGKEQ